MSKVIIYGDELYHHGIKGQKWYVRRYQNPDGSLTDLGRRHYGKTLNKLDQKAVDARGMYIKYDVKAKKALAKGKNDKYEKYSSLAKQFSDAQNRIEKDQWKIMADAANNGKNVLIKQGYKMTSEGQAWMGRAWFSGGVILGLPTAAILSTASSGKKYVDYLGDSPYVALGNTFKVKNKSKNQAIDEPGKITIKSLK